MDISIAVFFVELVRAACGGAWSAAQTWRTPEQAFDPMPAVRVEPSLADDADDASLVRPVVGVRIFPGTALWRETEFVDPTARGAVTQGSVLSTEDEALPDFLAVLAAAGVGIEPGAVHEGGGASAASSGTSFPPSVRYKLRSYTLIPPTPYVEPFTLMVPSPLPATVAPLVVIFHKFGSSHLDVLQNTDYVRQCAQRGWFLICPLGASKKHFSSLESQVNTQAVLDWTLANSSLRIDRQRIYGIGFSMGGGAALNYAARHRDPAHAVFAALINHTGTVALNDAYLQDPPARFIYDFWFGDGSAGSADPWKMTRSSVIDFDPITLAVDTSSDLARNLDSTPLQMLRAEIDTIPYLSVQNDVLDEHLRLNLGRQPGPSYSYTVVPYSGHSWTMLDPSAACDWLGQFTLQMPLEGRTLADVDGVYEHFFVEQDAGGAFTPFDWSCVPATNELQISATANLKRLTVDPTAAGLSTSAALSVLTQAADGTGDEIVLVRWPLAPSAVTRDGAATASWTYDPLTQDLALFEFDAAAHVWVVVP